MPTGTPHDGRTLGLLAATGVGVGATVGGGILALAGVAFATTGPSAIVAVALNGCIALITVVSFGELASRFPESGGTYTYARKVLTVEAAFAVGWIVWFASVVAAVLYALGFAVFLVPFLEQLIRATGREAPSWISGRFALLTYALAALGFYTRSLMRSSAGADQWATIGNLVGFAVLIGGGFWVLALNPPSLGDVQGRLTPFFENGASGLLQAMGYTFIALQGFDLIAAVGGQVKQPERNIPRAMFLSLGLALVVYLPLLLLIVLVGTDGTPVAAVAAADPEILVARAARTFLGPTGYWLVVVAGVLSMLSGMQANLMAASSFAGTMAADRTLPVRFDGVSGDGRTPLAAIKVTAGTIAFVLVAVPDVATAGAVSSLIFLTTFGLAHGIAYLARRRSAEPSPFSAPLFPLVPIVGGGACLTLALYQASAVPSAGVLAALWLSFGGHPLRDRARPPGPRGRRIHGGPRTSHLAPSRAQPSGARAGRESRQGARAREDGRVDRPQGDLAGPAPLGGTRVCRGPRRASGTHHRRADDPRRRPLGRDLGGPEARGAHHRRGRPVVRDHPNRGAFRV
jgi:APA family basic amino acid/polyamine antiporter